MATMYRIDLPWSCAESSNKRDRYSHQGGYTLARDETHAEASNQIDGNPIKGPVEVRLDLFPPEEPNPFQLARPFDAMNVPKAVLDGLEGVAYHNDYQVEIGHVYRRDATGAGKVIVQVKEIPRDVESYIVGDDGASESSERGETGASLAGADGE